MKVNPRDRLLLLLFGLAVACAGVSASRGLAAGLAPFWAICCQGIANAAASEMRPWISLLTRITVLSLLAFSVFVTLRRLRITQRFGASLRASVAPPPKRLARLFADLGLAEHVIVLAAEPPLAFCTGLLRPRIYISTSLADALTNTELKAVLVHENHHRRRFDPLRGLLADVFAQVLFFLPIAGELRDLILTTSELEADRDAVQHVGRPALAGALHNMLTHPRAARLSVPGLASLSATEVRIADLLGDRPTTPRISIHKLMTSSAIILLACMLAI